MSTAPLVRASVVSSLDVSAPRILESIPHIVWMTDADGSTEYQNSSGVGYTGRRPRPGDGWRWFDVVHADYLARTRQAWEFAVDGGSPYDVDCRLRRFDGEYRWHACRWVPFVGPGRVDSRWVITATDVHEQRIMEQRLRRSEQRADESRALLDALQSTAPVGFAFVDRDFRIRRINSTLAAVSGTAVEVQLGQTVADVVPALWTQIRPHFEHVIETGEPVVNVEIAGPAAPPTSAARAWLGSYFPVRLGNVTIGIGVVTVDITDRKQSQQELRSLVHAAVEAMAAAVEARDPYTAGHQRRVAAIARAIALDVGLNAEEVEGIGLAATLHDIGKIAVPAEILVRPGQLSPAEMEIVKAHPRAGYEIVAGIHFPWPLADMILQHHERLDGSGYPAGLTGDQISIGARIIAVADTVEAMGAHRPYRTAPGLEAALRVLQEGRGSRFDARAVDSCARLFRDGTLHIDLADGIVDRGGAADASQP